jgi:predicted dehydrogenase
VTLGAVVIGCGAVGSGYDEARPDRPPLSHAGAYAAEPRVELLAGVDPDPAARERFTARWGVPAYAGADEALLTHAPALVSLAGPAGSREATVEAALAHGVRGIWAEKPLAGDAAAAERIVERCRGVALQVNFLRRFDPLHQRVAELVGGGVAHADFRFSGTMANYGSHAIDLFHWLGGPVQRVTVQGDGLAWAAASSGATATFRRVATEGADVFDTIVYTARSRLMLTAMGEELTVAEPAPSELFPEHPRLGAGEAFTSSGLGGAMGAAVASLADAVQFGAPVPCSGEDGLAAMRVLELIEAAA